MDPRVICCVVLASLLIVSLAACTMPQTAALAPAVDSTVRAVPSPAPSPASTGILEGSIQNATFDQVKEGIDNLYRDHPAISSFAARGVTYTPETRDKVLKICHEGGLVSTAAERETQEVLACAPLIYFFYSYGHDAGVPASTQIARQLYWYAAGSHPGQPTQVLTELLRGWGIN